MKQELALKVHEADLLERNLAKTTQARALQELADAEMELKTHQDKVGTKRARLNELKEQLKDLENKLAHFQEFRAAQLKAREKDVTDTQKAREAALKLINEKKGVFDLYLIYCILFIFLKENTN